MAMFNKSKKADNEQQDQASQSDSKSVQNAEAAAASSDQATPAEQRELAANSVYGKANPPELSRTSDSSVQSSEELDKQREEHNKRQEELKHPDQDAIIAEAKKADEQLKDSQKHSDGTVPAQEAARADLESEKTFNRAS